MAKFGWCLHGEHEKPDDTGCPGKRRKWYFGTKREKRKTVEAVVFTDDFWECECKCHKKK